MSSSTTKSMVPTSMPPRPLEDRVAVVVNGNAKRVTDEIVQVLDQIVESGDLFVSRDLDEGHEIARTIVNRGYSTVLTGGGDGTFVQMVTWITQEAERLGKSPPRFGMLRLGTGNALAWVLGAQGGIHPTATARSVVADLARLRREGGSRSLRLLDVLGRLTPFCGFGADSVALRDYASTKEALQRTPLLRPLATGGLAYLFSISARTAPQYFFGQHEHVRIVNDGGPAARIGAHGQPVGPPIEKGEVIYEGPFRLVGMSTIRYWGFGARIFPYAEDQPDRFHLRIVCLHPLLIGWHLRSLWRGNYRGDAIYDFLAESVRVESRVPIPVQIGGDRTGDHSEFRVALSEKPIQVVDFYAPPPVE